MFKDAGYYVLSKPFFPKKYHSCYSDKLNHIVVNYDGKLYKCTARDYSNEVGILNENGTVTWNDEVMSRYFSKTGFENEKCLNCKLLPLCFGVCIQKKFENRDIESSCMLNYLNVSIEDYLKDRMEII